MGFKTFLSGTPLAAADIMTYLMLQANITCTNATRPSTPVQGETIYETDTDTWFYCSNATGPVWSNLVPAPVFMTFAGSGETSSSSGTATWVTMGSLTVPSWASTGVFTLTINSCNATSTASAANIFLKIGTSSSSARRISSPGSASRMSTMAINGKCTSVPTGVQTVTVQSTFVTSTFTAPSPCDFDLIVEWAA